MTDTEQYTPKKGDRVRVTYEGTVDWLGPSGTFELFAGDLHGHYSADPTRVSIEKLQDPEPEWVNGDVIQVVYERTVLGNPYGPRLLARINGEWVFADTGKTTGPWFMTNHWPGNVEVIHKTATA